METALCPFVGSCIVYKTYISDTKDNRIDILQWKDDQNYSNLGYYRCKALEHLKKQKRAVKKDLSEKIKSEKFTCSYLEIANR